MSFHSTITADELLPADVRAALALTDQDAVYAGRYPRQVRAGVEVWIERLPAEELVGFARLDLRRYRLHVRHGLTSMGPDQSGAAALGVVEAHLETLAERYDGNLRTADTVFLTRLPDLVAIRAVEEEVDEAPEDGAVLDGVVALEFLVRS